MTSISLPLRVMPKGLAQEDGEKRSIDNVINLILMTPRFSTPIDSKFGFVFNNLRFEMFNENEGVVFDSGETTTMDGIRGLYNKKISGSSKSLNTFASELKETVEMYESRLENISVSMTYVRQERQIYLTVKGIIFNTKEDYVYKRTYKVWN